MAADGSREPRPSDQTAAYDSRGSALSQAAAAEATLDGATPFTQQELGLTASRALRDADGQLRGVFGVDLTIRDLRALLAGQVRDADGRAHVLDRSGAVIASTEEPAPWRRGPGPADGAGGGADAARDPTPGTATGLWVRLQRRALAGGAASVPAAG